MIGWVYRSSRAVAHTAIRILFRFRAHGTENVPTTGPLIVAANHTSFLDPLLVGCALPRPIHYVMRANLLRVPILGWWFRAVGTIPVDRDAPGRGAIDAALTGLENDGVLCVFPEGTRSRDGRLNPFKRGLLLLARRSGASVLPTAVTGSFAAWPAHRRLPRLRRCAVHYGKPMTADELLAEGGLEQLRLRIAAMSGQSLADPDSNSDLDPADPAVSSSRRVVSTSASHPASHRHSPTNSPTQVPEGPAPGRA